MQANLTTIRGKRIFAEDFKRLIVKEYDKGKFSVLELSKLYHIDNNTIYRWIYKYSIFNEKSARIIEMKESSSKKLKDLEKRIKDLEQAVGQKQLKIDFYEKMMEIAKDEYGIDVKKNFDTPQSTGSEKTKK
jgi:transposase-like protein